jgi:hypothetical protein
MHKMAPGRYCAQLSGRRAGVEPPVEAMQLHIPLSLPPQDRASGRDRQRTPAARWQHALPMTLSEDLLDGIRVMWRVQLCAMFIYLCGDRRKATIFNSILTHSCPKLHLKNKEFCQLFLEAIKFEFWVLASVKKGFHRY